MAEPVVSSAAAPGHRPFVNGTMMDASLDAGGGADVVGHSLQCGEPVDQELYASYRWGILRAELVDKSLGQAEIQAARVTY